MLTFFLLLSFDEFSNWLIFGKQTEREKAGY